MTRDQRRRSEDAQVRKSSATQDTDQQLAQLDDRLGTGAGAVKERARLPSAPGNVYPSGVKVSEVVDAGFKHVLGEVR